MEKHKDLIATLKNYKIVIFDFDGTLAYLNIDWKIVKAKLVNYTKNTKNLDLSFNPLDQDIFYLKNKFGKVFFQDIIHIIEQEELQDMSPKINEIFVNYINQNFDQKIAIYTMNTRKCIDNFTQKYIKTKIDFIISKDNCIEPKPSGKNLLEIINKFKIKQDEAIYIGDSKFDVMSGKDANIKTLII